ncbi:MAG: hypothetical protein WCA12_13690 [Burkholderiales bacterium]
MSEPQVNVTDLAAYRAARLIKQRRTAPRQVPLVWYPPVFLWAPWVADPRRMRPFASPPRRRLAG